MDSADSARLRLATTPVLSDADKTLRVGASGDRRKAATQEAKDEQSHFRCRAGCFLGRCCRGDTLVRGRPIRACATRPGERAVGATAAAIQRDSRAIQPRLALV